MPHIVFDKGHHQIFHLSQSISAKDFCISQTIPQMQVCFHLWPQVTAQQMSFLISDILIGLPDNLIQAIAAVWLVVMSIFVPTAIERMIDGF